MKPAASAAAAVVADPLQTQAPTPMPTQADFAQALLDPLRPCPSGLRSRHGALAAASRFAVHRNNAVASLVEALGDGFPVVRELVGDDFFGAMARAFIRAAPPRSPVLALYGDAFAGFVEGYAPAAVLPYLADMARLEYLRVQAVHAADAPALGAADVAARLADPAALPGARLRLHPSAALLASRHAVVSLWAAHQGLVELAAVDPSEPQCALVLRRPGEDDAAVIGVAPGDCGLMRRLQDGATLGDAVGAAAALDAGFDLAAALGLLIGQGVLSSWQASAETGGPP